VSLPFHAFAAKFPRPSSPAESHVAGSAPPRLFQKVRVEGDLLCFCAGFQCGNPVPRKVCEMRGARPTARVFRHLGRLCFCFCFLLAKLPLLKERKRDPRVDVFPDCCMRRASRCKALSGGFSPVGAGLSAFLWRKSPTARESWLYKYSIRHHRRPGQAASRSVSLGPAIRRTPVAGKATAATNFV
jgi:hypothetical protein